MVLALAASIVIGQEKSIKDLDFLIGTWETREDIADKEWWETSTREIAYTLKGNFIEINARSIDSNGKEREYNWYINYNKKTDEFQMTSMFSNWHKVQQDILEWDPDTRTLTIRHKPGVDDEYHERLGKLVFDESLTNYTWTGENKYGDPVDPGIWRYVETGRRVSR